MTTNLIPDATAAALARLERMRKSTSFRDFFQPEAIEAFAQIEGSVLAGKAMKEADRMPPEPRPHSKS